SALTSAEWQKVDRHRLYRGYHAPGLGVLLHLHHQFETRSRPSRGVLLAARGRTRRHPRPRQRSARGHRGSAEDVWLEDARQDRTEEPLVSRGFGKIGAILNTALIDAGSESAVWP